MDAVSHEGLLVVATVMRESPNSANFIRNRGLNVVVRVESVGAGHPLPFDVDGIALLEVPAIIGHGEIDRQPGLLVLQKIHAHPHGGRHVCPQNESVETSVSRDRKRMLATEFRFDESGEIQIFKKTLIRNNLGLREIPDAKPHIKFPSEFIENVLCILPSQGTENWILPHFGGKFYSCKIGQALRRNGDGSWIHPAPGVVGDGNDPIGTADIANDSLRPDVHGFGQGCLGRITTQHNDPVLHAQPCHQLAGTLCCVLKNFDGIDFAGTRLGCIASQEGVLSGPNVEDDPVLAVALERLAVS